MPEARKRGTPAPEEPPPAPGTPADRGEDAGNLKKAALFVVLAIAAIVALKLLLGW